MNPSALQTSAEKALEKPAAAPQTLVENAQLDFERAVAAGVERVLAAEGFSANELADDNLRRAIAERLYDLRYFESVADAQEFMEILSADALGRVQTPAMATWLAEHRALLVKTRELRERGIPALQNQQELRAAEKEWSHIDAMLRCERGRLANYSRSDEIGRQVYFGNYVGQKEFTPAVEFMKVWLAEKEVARYTAEVVIPELERQLDAAARRVAALRTGGESSGGSAGNNTVE